MKLRELYEAKVSGKAVSAAMANMVSYIGKKLGVPLIRIPGIEQFTNSDETGFGLRYVFSGSTKSLRFNWQSRGATGKSAELMSINYWNGTSRDPSLTIKPQGVSLVQVLPSLVKLLANPKIGKFAAFPANPKEESPALVEARRGDYSPESALDDALAKMKAGHAFTRSEFIGAYHISNVGVFDTLVNGFADRLEIEGRRISISPSADVNDLKRDVLEKAGTIIVTRGGSNEKYAATSAEKEINERIPFAETLEHLEGLVSALVKGAFNALFVAGKGGTGKTQTVESVLAKEGLMDGIGYFKNTGTASPAGVYALLYHHRKDIILFDDSDGALADQDARNIIKAATDTKKKRKLVWNKKSSFIFDPESDNADEYEDDPMMAPKYFDFEGRIIFISNLPLNKLDPDGALRTRAFVINVDPTDEELFEHMEKILHKIKLEDGLTLSAEQREEVLQIVKNSKSRGDVSLRKLVRALNLAASGAPNWKKLVDLYS